MSEAEKRPVNPNLNWKDLCAIWYWLGWIMRLIVYWINKHAFFKVLEYVAKIAVLVSLSIYFYQGEERAHQAEQSMLQTELNAWNMLYTHVSGYTSKIKALEYLNKTGVDLSFLNLPDKRFCGIDLSNAKLIPALFNNTNLSEANFKNADLEGTNLHFAGLRGADLRGAKNLTVEQLCSARTLYEAKLDSELLETVKAQCPAKLEPPKYISEC